MTRGLGIVVNRSAVPPWIEPLAGIITQFGDLWFVTVVAVMLLGVSGWGVTRRISVADSAFVLALALGAYALTVILKFVFELPRPPGATTAVVPVWVPPATSELYTSMVTASGFGFPSGHALKSTAVYGGAALLFSDWGRRWLRIGGAIGVVSTISLSRIVLGVHYTVDILVGMGCGALFLWVMWTSARGSTRRAFWIAGLLSAGAAVVSLQPVHLLVVVGVIGGGLAVRYLGSDTTVGQGTHSSK